MLVAALGSAVPQRAFQLAMCQNKTYIIDSLASYSKFSGVGCTHFER